MKSHRIEEQFPHGLGVPSEVHTHLEFLYTWLSEQADRIDDLCDSGVIDDDQQDFLMAQVHRTYESVEETQDQVARVLGRMVQMGMIPMPKRTNSPTVSSWT